MVPDLVSIWVVYGCVWVKYKQKTTPVAQGGLIDKEIGLKVRQSHIFQAPLVVVRFRTAS